MRPKQGPGIVRYPRRDGDPAVLRVEIDTKASNAGEIVFTSNRTQLATHLKANDSERNAQFKSMRGIPLDKEALNSLDSACSRDPKKEYSQDGHVPM